MFAALLLQEIPYETKQVKLTSRAYIRTAKIINNWPAKQSYLCCGHFAKSQIRFCE